MVQKDKRAFIKYAKQPFIFLVAACLFLCSCQSTSIPTSNHDIITQKKSEEGRTQITLMSKYAFSVTDFEKKIEAKFPDIDIVVVGDYTSNTALAKGYEAMLENDDLTDIVCTWPLNIGSTYWSDRLIDMSGMSFSKRYNVSMLDTIADDNGNLFYLPGPASIRGIVYNKTMFEENGWNVPTTYTQFVALCKQIEESGNRAFQLPLKNEEVLDTAFISFNYGTAYSKPKDNEWLTKYDEGEGSFLDHFATSVDTFQNLMDEGIIQASDLELTYADTQANLYNRGTVMTEDSAQLINLAKTIGGSSDEYAIMPFFNRDPENTWARIYMVCYIGMNKHLQDSENKEKYEKVLKIMDYISTEEGQNALSSGNGSMFSHLKGAKAPKDIEILDMQTTLEEGRYGLFPTLKLSESALREGLADMLKGNMNKEQLGAYVDAQNRHITQEGKEAILGEASKTFTLIDTGSFISDVLRTNSKCDFALYLDNGKDGFYNGKGVSSKFYKGSITQEDIDRILPDLKTGDQGELWKITMSGENLKKTLEYSIKVGGNQGWIYYFSGLKISYDPLAKMGSRVKHIETSDGKNIKDNELYSIAVMDHSVPEDYIISCEKTGLLIKDLLVQEIVESKTILPAKDGRFTIVEE